MKYSPFLISYIRKEVSRLKGFSQLEKITEEVGGRILYGCDGGSMVPLVQTVSPVRKVFSNGIRERSSITGFTLIEIMIVVGIVMILAIIGIPNFLRSKLQGNETNAIAALRTLGNACNFYTISNDNFPPTAAAGFTALYTASPPYVNFDYSLTQTTPKDGYVYTYTNVASLTNPTFTIIARPSRWRVTGVKSLYIDSIGVIRYCDTSANCALTYQSTPLQ